MRRWPKVRAAAQLKDPNIREAEFQDYGQISALHVRNGLATRFREDWMALWTGNPAYNTSRQHCPIGWVLENDKGEIVGSIGNIPLTYHFRRRELRAAAPCSWVVDPPYRGYSMLI